MANIIDTLDCIEGVEAGGVRFDEDGHPVDTPSAVERAGDLFLVMTLPLLLTLNPHMSQALDKDNDGSLTKQEFLTGYTKRSNTRSSHKMFPFICFHSLLCRSHILKKQDADDQRRKLNCLIFLGPVLNTRAVETDACSPWLASVISLRTGVRVGKEDIAFSEIKKINEEKKSAFVRLVCPNNSFYQLTFKVCRH